VQSWLVALVAIRSLEIAEEFWTVQNSLRRLSDCSAIGLLSVCARTARTVVAVRSSMVALLLYSVWGRTSVLRLHCDYVVRTATTKGAYCDNEPTYCERGRSRSPQVAYSCSKLAVQSEYSRTIRISSTAQKHCNPLRSVFRCDRKTATERRPRCDVRRPSAIWSRRGRRKSQLDVTGVLCVNNTFPRLSGCI